MLSLAGLFFTCGGADNAFDIGVEIDTVNLVQNLDEAVCILT